MERRRAKIPQQAIALVIAQNIVPVEISVGDALAVQVRRHRGDAMGYAQGRRSAQAQFIGIDVAAA
ncbi:hypothetical protein D3C76_1354160 [compost metagenome]